MRTLVGAPGRPVLETSAGGGLPLAVVTATAAANLVRYQLSALLRGPSPRRAQQILQRWSVHACRWLRLDVRMHGQPFAGACAYVANHRSYLDIPVLSAALGASFMSRADIAGWTLVGAAATAIGTVFVEREDLRGRVRAARALGRRLRTDSVVIFPEGTTGGAILPGAFHPGLFRLLHRLGVPVVPVTIRYSDRRAYWTDDIGLATHLRRRVLSGPRLAATVHVADRLDAPACDGGPSLARAAHAAVCRTIEEFGELA